MQTTPPVTLPPSGEPITAVAVSVLKECTTTQGTQPEARALRPQLVTLAQRCRAAQLIAENRYLVTNDPISNMRVSIIKEAKGGEKGGFRPLLPYFGGGALRKK